MISHKHKCIFIHIPKCAGTSIEKAFGHFDEYDGRGRQDHRTVRAIVNPIKIKKIFLCRENISELTKRIKSKLINKTQNPKNRYTVTEEQFEQYFKFTFVRNPWARAFSWYKNVIRDEVHINNYGISSNITFEDFLDSFLQKTTHLKSQFFWLKDFDGSIPMDFIGKFENLEDDFKTITTRLNLDSIELPHLLNAGIYDYKKHYNKKCIKIVENFYKEEIDTFEYSF